MVKPGCGRYPIISRIIQIEITRYILAKLALGCDGQSKARNIFHI